jgi:hypothetical protein
MENMSDLQYFLKKIVTPTLVCLSVICNLSAFAVYSRNRFKNIPGRDFLRLLCLSDLSYTVQVVILLIYYFYNVDLSALSAVNCKLIRFSSYLSQSLSAWFLVYISIERLCSIIFVNKFAFLNKKKHQFLIVTILIGYNIIFYVPYLVLYDVSTYYVTKNVSVNNPSNYTLKICEISLNRMYLVFSWLNFFNSTFIPFVIMILCSVLLIIKIFESRKRTLYTGNGYPNKRLVKDVRFSITIVLLNIAFVTFNTPFCLYLIMSKYNATLFLVFFELVHLNTIINFLIYFASNSLFRRELFKMLLLSKLYNLEKNSHNETVSNNHGQLRTISGGSSRLTSKYDVSI